MRPMTRPLLILIILMGMFASYWVAVTSTGIAQQIQADPLPSQPAPVMPGNYCLSCHSADDSRLNNPTAWRGSIDAAGVTPCPAMTRIHEEIYYTERLLLAIDRYKATLPSFVDTWSLDGKLAAGQQGYFRLLDSPVTSLDAFTAEAQSVRFTLGKVYTGLQDLDYSTKRTRTLMVGLVVSLILFGALIWGLYNTRHVKAQAGKIKPASIVKATIFMLLIAAFFSLPILRLPPQADAATDAESQAVQTTLDTVQRSADASGRQLARAWMMSEIAKVWSGLDQSQAAIVLEQAKIAAAQARAENTALWGDAIAAQEAAASDPASLEQAGLIAAEVDAARSRAWIYRWMALSDPRLIQTGLVVAQDAQGIYQDLDRRTLAAEQAATNLDAALQTLTSIDDPAVRAWGLREAAIHDPTPETAEAAVEAARHIDDPVRQALSLAEIYRTLGDPAILKEALNILETVPEPSRSYALAYIARAGEDASFVVQIDHANYTAQTLALIYSGSFADAWETSVQIADPIDRARAQIEIATQWSQVDPQKAKDAAATVDIPLLRDRAVRNVIRYTGDESLVDQIDNSYDRVIALISLGQFSEAFALAGELKEAYPLGQLALDVAAYDPQAALEMVDYLQREVDKAEVLRAVAVKTGDPETFERALAMAAAARIRGDALAPARATLELAIDFINSSPQWAGKALTQALQLAERISIK